MIRYGMMLLLAGFSPLAAPLSAQAQEEQAGRFQLERTEKGIVRLDTQSGTLTLCHEKEGNLVCRMAADERAAYEEELDRLTKRVEALENGTQPGQRDEKRLGRSLPSDADIDRSFAIMEKMMKRFMGLAEELNREKQGDRLHPQKT